MSDDHGTHYPEVLLCLYLICNLLLMNCFIFIHHCQSIHSWLHVCLFFNGLLASPKNPNQMELVFSSPELKAKVSFSDRLSSGICLSVCPSVCKLFLFSTSSHHWVNFNQTWHKACLGEGDSSLFK